ncbi:MAG: alpha/beta hydrolase [Chitinophagaceae bacterium]|nr:alpha/beta hydrolase [Chitinophagaceae bacterium]
MRSIILTLFLMIAFSSFGQEDVGKKMAEFQKAQSDPKAVPYGKNAAAGKFYDIRGFKMYCEIYGTGEPLLIIHGNGGSIDNFIYQIPYFAKHYKVIIADSRAQGKSADTGDTLTYEMMADDYAALLDALKIDSANVIGWSDGGINGILLAQRHPRKVKKLAITGANLAPDTTAVPQEIWDMVRPALAALSAKSAKTPQEKNALKLLRLLCEQPNIDPASLKNIQCPTLVIGGDHDVIKEEHTFLIYKNIPKAYLWILPGAGHSTPIIYAEDFNRVVERFFKNPFVKIEGEARFM